MNKPKHKHDCNLCIYLGRHKVAKTVYDLYYHPGDKTTQSLIARFSSNDPDYLSGIRFGKHHVEEEKNYSAPLGQAYLRASYLKLIQ